MTSLTYFHLLAVPPKQDWKIGKYLNCSHLSQLNFLHVPSDKCQDGASVCYMRFCTPIKK